MADIPFLNRAPGEILARRGARPVTAGEYLADVAALAARLPGAPYALNLCEDRYLALVAFGAALARGVVTLLSADRSPHRQRELLARYPGTIALADGVETVIPAVTAGAWGRGGGENFDLPEERVAAIGFTSGSTGEPAAHAKPWGALVAAARSAAARFGLDDPEDGATVIGTVPAQHMYGFETTVMLPLRAPVAVHSGPHFYPVEVAEALAAAPGRRVLVTTPLQLRALVAGGVSGASAVISATAPLSPALAAEAEARLGAPVLEIYGATEMGSIASRRTIKGEGWTLYDGVALRAEGGEEAAALVPGLPGPVPLSDLVEIGADGRFRLIGRRGDMVKRGGKRASLAGLNRVLTEIEGVQDGVFIAPEDLEANPAARLAALVVAPGRTPAEIVAALRERVEAVFLPRPVVLVERLPRNAVGKITRRSLEALRDTLADGRDG
ncbi:AMP-binding protein [Muricoccus pecuniae]|uniref:Acyl-coenzyme A synthetase/AMP-(Fatty) acid ligase n=1 Tax=Muricoccus pecuniae TaxID=693023 RepID=A0A840YI75_9PROT|nr:AMP-binding protein [Roseomonas pecuniae]MBB5694262.1 acyl-coenzyme A synthetase/AMP-(fatty) acid ligase [Roseomonas pecuniae]